MHSRNTIRFTEGVIRVSNGYAHPEVGVLVSSDHPQLRSELLDAGLVSEISAPWWRARISAVVLRPSARNGILLSFLHNSRGMFRWIIFCSAVIIAAELLDNVGLLGIGISFILFIASILLHEASHVCAFQAVAAKRYAILVSAGLRCHMVRPALQGWREIVVVVAGPFGPLLPLIFLIHWIAQAPFLLWFWVAIAIGHVSTLLAPVGDGANLRRALSRRQ